MPSHADDFYRLLAIMESKAKEHGIDTGLGDWFRAEIRDYEHRDEVARHMTDQVAVPKHQLTLWFTLK